MMIQFFYTQTYQCLTATPTGPSAATSEQELKDHSEVSVVADKYDVPDLQILAVEKYLQILQKTYITINPLPTLTRLFGSASSADSPVYDVLLPFWLRRSFDLRKMYGEAPLKSLISESKHLATHVTTLISGAEVLHDCSRDRKFFAESGNSLFATHGCNCSDWIGSGRVASVQGIFIRTSES